MIFKKQQNNFIRGNKSNDKEKKKTQEKDQRNKIKSNTCDEIYWQALMSTGLTWAPQGDCCYDVHVWHTYHHLM